MKKIMKQKKFKINSTTLFVYRTGRSSTARGMETPTSDPTTIMITTTVTGFNGKQN
jgi:Na+/H+ antiporter NhaD/arsenite permease-like protein